MIVNTTIDEDGAVTVTVDTDGDQGSGYSAEVMGDMVTRAGNSAVELWLKARAEMYGDEPAEE